MFDPAFQLGCSFVITPYVSMSAVMTENSTDRSGLAGARSIGSVVTGVALSPVLPPQFEDITADDIPLRFTIATIVLALVALALFGVCFRTTREVVPAGFVPAVLCLIAALIMLAYPLSAVQHDSVVQELNQRRARSALGETAPDAVVVLTQRGSDRERLAARRPVVTINEQHSSGGAYIGAKDAEQLGVPYAGQAFSSEDLERASSADPKVPAEDTPGRTLGWLHTVDWPGMDVQVAAAVGAGREMLDLDLPPEDQA